MTGTAASATQQPTRVRVRMYQVGFGDCFLVSFEYPTPLDDGRAERHLLTDFGTMRLPEGGGDLLSVAEQIRTHCHGRLDVVVATHRHKDHLSGFGSAQPAAILDTLAPRLVVRPWTEHPDVPADATGPLGARSQAFAGGLAVGQSFAAALAAEIAAKARGVRADLRQLAFDQLRNQEAIARLDAWAQAGTAAYVFAGSPSRIEEVVPGIRVTVLGPPTVEQWEQVTGQREQDPEFWMLYHQLVTQGLAPGTLSSPSHPIDDDARNAAHEEQASTPAPPPGPVRWLVERLRSQQVASLQRIVRTLDDALNNTSVILLIEAGTQRLLLPGDAQIENWGYTLRQAEQDNDLRTSLRRVGLYKVGHHGSRNATPRSLYNLWSQDDPAAHPMTALMSTLKGVHGKTEATAVPRATLVAALQQRATLYSTEDLSNDEGYVEVVADTTSHQPFQSEVLLSQ